MWSCLILGQGGSTYIEWGHAIEEPSDDGFGQFTSANLFLASTGWYINIFRVGCTVCGDNSLLIYWNKKKGTYCDRWYQISLHESKKSKIEFSSINASIKPAGIDDPALSPITWLHSPLVVSIGTVSEWESTGSPIEATGWWDIDSGELAVYVGNICCRAFMKIPRNKDATVYVFCNSSRTPIHISSLLKLKRLESGLAYLQLRRWVCMTGTKSAGLSWIR